MRAPPEDGVGLAHVAQVGHELPHAGVVDRDFVRVDRGQREACAVQERRGIGGACMSVHKPACQLTDHGGDAVRNATPALLFGELQARAELEQRVASEHGGDEHAVRPEQVLRLREGADNVADPVQAAGADDRVHLVRVLLQLGVVQEVGRRALNALRRVWPLACKAEG